MVHLNVRSILKIIDQLLVLLHDLALNVVTFSETWLKAHIHSELLVNERLQTI